MASKLDRQFIGEVLDLMAERALEKGERTEIAIERFSLGVDRLVAWLPAALREETLEQARSHSYCSPDQIVRLHLETAK